ncbi:MAG: hypothetical protein BJ554DRAFT_6141 [Olpidium bornovanus]|uniref:Protein kinase domain-containing protein n=1 Tax=Olpidium bornovanus TaxID=278681 RepID=A0A8H8DKF4_9FUNG|nr:MAG: hypothetical protein BJ554DRAFT_6141 [Olpidium bornovanus]
MQSIHCRVAWRVVGWQQPETNERFTLASVQPKTGVVVWPQNGGKFAIPADDPRFVRASGSRQPRRRHADRCPSAESALTESVCVLLRLRRLFVFAGHGAGAFARSRRSARLPLPLTLRFPDRKRVKLAVDPTSQRSVAVKIIQRRASKDSRSAIDRKQLDKEIIIHSALRHENIIRLLGSDTDETYLYIVLEYAAGGELFDKIGQRTTAIRALCPSSRAHGSDKDSRERVCQAPDVGIEEDLAHFYFTQLVAGVVRTASFVVVTEERLGRKPPSHTA